MTKQKSTKRALLMSALALVMCLSMLIGSTFAWFTDSVNSGSNVITAGNLDLVVEYTLDGTNWKDLDGAKDLFQKGLWEPGHTEVVALRIKNNGTLALKYVANMNIINETVGKTKDGSEIRLSDILTVSTLVQQAIDADGNANQIGDITLGLAFSGENSVAYENTTTFKAGNVLDNDVELHPGAAHYLIVKVDMAETVGNEANHNGTDIPQIYFGINVLATQFTYEYDSFGNQYDKDATYINAWDGTVGEVPAEEDGVVTISTPAQLAAFAADVNNGNSYSGKTVVLANDIDLGNQTWTPIGDCVSRKYFQGTFDGQGNTIYNLYVDKSTDESQFSTAGLFGWVDAAGATVKNLNVDGATVLGSHWVGVIAGYWTDTIENCSVNNATVVAYNVNDDANGDKVGGIVGYLNDDSDINNNTVTNSTITGNRDIGGIVGAVAETIDSMSNNKVSDTVITYTTEKDYGSAGAIVSGRTGYTPNETNVATNVTILKVVTTAAELETALATGEANINIAGSITLTKSLSATDVTLVGVSEDAAINFAGYNITGKGDITYKDLTLTTISLPNIPANGERYGWYGGIDYAGHATANYENCTISGIFTLYSKTVNVTGCTFLPYVQDGTTFNQIFQYGTQTANIEDCTFNYSNRAIKIYNEGGTKDLVMNVTGCTFKADESFDVNYDDNKALISIDPTYVTSVKLAVKDVTIDDALNGIDLHNGEGNDKITVTVE